MIRLPCAERAFGRFARACHDAGRLLGRPRAGGVLGDGVYVVGYHHVTGVLAEDIAAWGALGIEKLATEAARFAEHIDFYQRTFRIVSADEALRLLRDSGGAPRGRHLVLTFDDGYASLRRHVFPLLAASGLPCCVFPNGRPLLRCEGLPRLRLSALLAREGAAMLKDFQAAFGPGPGTIGELFAVFKRDYIPAHADWVDAWWARAAPEPLRAAERGFFLSLDEVRALDPGQVAVGSHTWSHPNVGRLSVEDAREEIVGCHRAMEDALGRRLQFFAYPYGASGYFTDETERLVAEAGLVGFSTIGAVNRSFRPGAIRRFCPTNETVDELAAALTAQGE